MQEAARLFEGYHDFSRFAKMEEGRDPMRRVHSVCVSENVGHIIVDVKGESFLWNMVRRMSRALNMVGEGECEPEDIKSALEGGTEHVFPPLPPGGLVLMDVLYDLDFQSIDNPVGKRELENIIYERELESLVASEIVSYLSK